MNGKERPIIFNSEMVRAILEDRKIQTRRVIKPQPPKNFRADIANKVLPIGYCSLKCSYGKPGDRLWVRETFFIKARNVGGKIKYKVDDPEAFRAFQTLHWKPSIHMPRWASRITLEITDVKVERVQGISEGDCEKEGIYTGDILFPTINTETKYVEKFKFLWNSIHGKDAWEKNEWVWVISFRRRK